MPEGERQWSSEWLPVELQGDEPEAPDSSEAAGAGEGAKAFLPSELEPATGDEAKPAEPVKKSLPGRIGQGYGSKAGQSNGGSKPDWQMDRLMERAERAKNALQDSGNRGEEVDERVRSAAADAAMAAVREAEARAGEAAVTADRLAAKVADLSERLAEQEQELRQLRNATEVAERLSEKVESLSARLTEREEELTRLRVEMERRDAEPDRPEESQAADEPKPAAASEVSHQPREPAHRRHQTKPATLDLNEVGFDELCSFGLSVKQAARLVGYREQRGGFESPSDLDRLSGMPEETIEALKHAAGG